MHSPEELGATLFEVTQSKIWLVPAILVGGPCFLAVTSLLRDGDTYIVWVPLTVTVIATLFAAWVLRYRFTCHKSGVRLRGLVRNRSMLYRDVHGFAYGATRDSVNGVYSGTTLRLAFTGAGGERLTVARNTWDGSADLDALRDFVSDLVAEKMFERMVREGSVAWGNGARLTPSSLEFRAKKLLGTGAVVTVPYTPRRFEWEVRHGTFRLYIEESRSSALAMSCADANFFPGLLLLERMSRRQTGSAAANG